MRKLLWLCLLASSCGSSAQLGIGVRTSALSQTPAMFDVRVFGPQLPCETVLASPSGYVTRRFCEEGDDTSTDCALVHVKVRPGQAARLGPVRSGHRSVFIIARDDSDAAIGVGCSETDVRDGEAAPVTVDLADAAF
ncbi:MAG: hypothetical protein QM765_23080 [Myxococcales bacterium]